MIEETMRQIERYRCTQAKRERERVKDRWRRYRKRERCKCACTSGGNSDSGIDSCESVSSKTNRFS